MIVKCVDKKRESFPSESGMAVVCQVFSGQS